MKRIYFKENLINHNDHYFCVHKTCLSPKCRQPESLFNDRKEFLALYIWIYTIYSM